MASPVVRPSGNRFLTAIESFFSSYTCLVSCNFVTEVNSDP